MSDNTIEMITAGYIRVSTSNQNTDRQELRIKPLITSDRYLFVDKASGKDFSRPQYQLMKQVLRKGDTLIITSLDRLGRNAKEMEVEWKDLQDRGINIKVLDMPLLDTSTKDDLTNQLVSKIVFDLLSYFAEIERVKIKTRQAEGIRAARLAKKHLGRPKKEITPKMIIVFEMFQNREITGRNAAKELNIGESTFYKLRKIWLTGKNK